MIEEKCVPVKRRQNSVEIDRGSYYNKGYIHIILQFSDGKGAFYNGNESDNNSDNDDENYNVNNEQ